MTKLWRLLLATWAIAVVMASGLGPVAQAQSDSEISSAPGLELGWEQLGMNPAVYFGATYPTQTLSVPVPSGLEPRQVRGVVHPGSNIASGYLEATDADGRFLGSIPVPSGPDGRAPLPFTIDVTDAKVAGDRLLVNLNLQITSGDPICGPPPSLEVSDVSVTFTGALPPPKTVQQFFPAVAPALDIYVDPMPTPAEQLTTLNVVAALTHRYRPAIIGITLHPLGRDQRPPVAPGGGIRRAIVIRDAGEPGIGVVTDTPAPYLAVTGQGKRLEEQAGLFRGDLLAAAQTSRTGVESTQPPSAPGPRSVTFGQIQANGTAAALGTGTISLDLAAARFPVAKPGAIDIHLLANYTPVQDDEKGTLIVGSAGTVLYTAELNTSGRVDSRFTIPSVVAARNAALVLTLNYQPSAGACNPRTVPMTFQVDPASTATRTDGAPVAMGGFASLPQGFTPTFQVATDASDFNTLNRAAQLVALVQQASGEALRPQLVSLDDAATSNSGALIIANAESVNRYELDPPIGASGQLTSIEATDAGAATIPDGLASIQAFAQNNRTVLLVTTSGDWSLTEPLFTHLAALKNGWTDLSGDVLLAGQGAQPQTLTIRAAGPVELPAASGTHWKLVAWLVAGVLLVMAGLVAFLYLRRRRNTKAARGDNAKTAAEGAGA